MLSICDIVLNHTANESPWLREHPECTYNLQNCPHLRPAYLLDLTLYKFSLEVSKGLWEFSGVPAEVNCDEHLQVSLEDNVSIVFLEHGCSSVYISFWNLWCMCHLRHKLHCAYHKWGRENVLFLEKLFFLFFKNHMWRISSLLLLSSCLKIYLWTWN